MIKTVNKVGSQKNQKLPPNQLLISNFFFLATNPNSQLNVGHNSVLEKNDDEDIVINETNVL